MSYRTGMAIRTGRARQLLWRQSRSSGFTEEETAIFPEEE